MTKNELYYIRIGKEIEDRTRYSKYDPNGEYGYKEAALHAFEAKHYLSTGRKRVSIEKETTIVEVIETL